ncbi:MAG: hypothetical protein ACFCU1_09415 [Sumerlaeia bacterium]
MTTKSTENTKLRAYLRGGENLYQGVDSLSQGSEGLSGESVDTRSFEQRFMEDFQFSLMPDEIREVLRFLSGEPIVQIADDRFPMGTKPAEIHESLGKSVFLNPDLGEVRVTKSNIRYSFSHFRSQERLNAFAAIGEVIEKGKIFGTEVRNEKFGTISHIVGAPIAIGEKEYLMGVIVHVDGDGSRLNFQDVILKDKFPRIDTRGEQEDAQVRSRKPLAIIDAEFQEFFEEVRRIDQEGTSVDDNGDLYSLTPEERQLRDVSLVLSILVRSTDVNGRLQWIR